MDNGENCETGTDASFEKHADDDMAKTAKNWKARGASNPGRYTGICTRYQCWEHL